MLNEEARWISDNLSILKLSKNSIILNFGSQNIKYNKENKYLMNYVITPIKNN